MRQEEEEKSRKNLFNFDNESTRGPEKEKQRNYIKNNIGTFSYYTKLNKQVQVGSRNTLLEQEATDSPTKNNLLLNRFMGLKNGNRAEAGVEPYKNHCVEKIKCRESMPEV